MKKALVISCFLNKNNTSRPYLAYKYLSDKLETKVVYSEFSHDYKEYRTIDDKDMIGIKPLKYKSNISINRIISHIDFSIKTQKFIKMERPDLIYIAVPPNILGYLSIKTAKKIKANVIVDIVDLWPEALPIPSKIKKIMDLSIGILWSGMRSYCINEADYVISESQYFKDKLGYNNKSKINVIHLCKIMDGNLNVERNDFYIDNECLNIGYLGAMNSIYDFESLIEICDKVSRNRKLKLSIIGDGERRKWLLDELDKKNINYEYFGKIFDESKKYEILSSCDFGFNGYKDDTEVALSYKSIDYLSYGIGLINSAKGDTWNIIDNDDIGINYYSKSLEDVINTLSKIEKNRIIEMKKKSYKAFIKNFSWDKYKEEMEKAVMNLKN